MSKKKNKKKQPNQSLSTWDYNLNSKDIFGDAYDCYSNDVFYCGTYLKDKYTCEERSNAFNQLKNSFYVRADFMIDILEAGICDQEADIEYLESIEEDHEEEIEMAEKCIEIYKDIIKNIRMKDWNF